MKHQEISNENQIILFDLIQKELSANLSLVNVISDLLDISADAAYRRIRGVKPIDFEEAVKLCRHFQISMDSFANITRKNKIQCNYLPLNLSDFNGYMIYMQTLSANIERIKTSPKGQIILSALDIPVFNMLAYKELTFFKIFSWYKNVYGFSAGYDEFVEGLNTDELLKLYEKIVKDYQLIPSTEIWTSNTIDTFLRLLSYHYETGSFNDEKFPLFLCEQLLDMMTTLQNWTEKGTKGSQDVPLNFYVSETDLEGTFIILKQQEKTSCILKLYTINSLSTTDELFCQETENWLNNAAQRATLISGASAKTRYKFFNDQRQKIRFLIEKLQLNSEK